MDGCPKDTWGCCGNNFHEYNTGCLIEITGDIGHIRTCENCGVNMCSFHWCKELNGKTYCCKCSHLIPTYTYFRS